jgi:hypothetical protein
MSFTSRDLLRNHGRNVHFAAGFSFISGNWIDGKDEPVECLACNGVFKNRASLKHHFRIIHQLTPEQRLQWTCPECHKVLSSVRLCGC